VNGRRSLLAAAGRACMAGDPSEPRLVPESRVGRLIAVLLLWVEAEGFLSFGERTRLHVGPGLLVVTGPNGSGKSNLGRCLDLARAAIGRAGGDPAADRLDVYDDAGYEGAGSFTVRVGIELDQGWERHLVWAFVCSGFASGIGVTADAASADDLDATVRAWLVKESLAPLWSGSLVIHHRAGAARPWSAAWEFGHTGKLWHVVLAGEGPYQLRPGKAEFPGQARGSGSFRDWLLASKPQDELSMDFRVAMQEAGQPITFSAGSAGDRVPESMRELGSALGADPADHSFGFDQVLSVVLQRGIVLTDNRRLPLKRRFTLAELEGPADLRDGAGVAAELFRLKNGIHEERDRFEKIRLTFRELTGRSLDVRARPASDDGDPGMIIEPTVAGLHGERLLELSGAGMQEALVLSVLLRQEPGQVVVLDEPAVNLEPTVQRRLMSRVRGPGQYIVITHSADLVPVDEPEDLQRIVRIAPGRSGSQVRQPQFSGLGTDEVFRQLRLLEPAQARGLLFARAVILCEGPTEVGALPRWWRDARSIGLPDPQAANIPVISVDGDSGFGAYIRYLDAFGVPWALVADGPALYPRSKLTSQLQKTDHWPDKQPDEQDDFAVWREFWETLGVFTLADQFGDDGSKGGEFEAYLKRVDQTLLTAVEAEIGKKNKPRVGACFAVRHPDPPAEVLDLYRQIATWLGIKQQFPDTTNRLRPRADRGSHTFDRSTCIA
jgi:energy-coupling factor transporter ATP-binding protein EcfA2